MWRYRFIKTRSGAYGTGGASASRDDFDGLVFNGEVLQSFGDEFGDGTLAGWIRMPVSVVWIRKAGLGASVPVRLERRRRRSSDPSEFGLQQLELDRILL